MNSEQTEFIFIILLIFSTNNSANNLAFSFPEINTKKYIYAKYTDKNSN